MVLFLQGPPRTGKSTLLRGALLPHRHAVAGFMVQRLLEEGLPRAYRACAVNGGALPEPDAAFAADLPGLFIHRGTLDMAALNAVVSQARQNSERPACKLIILDEIGGLELTDGAFSATLDSLLALGKPCVGVLKSRENLQRAADRAHAPGDILQRHEALQSRLEGMGRVLWADAGSLANAARAVEAFVAGVMRG